MNDGIFKNKLAELNTLIYQFGGVDSYTTEQAYIILKKNIELIMSLGLDPNERIGFLSGIRCIYNIEFQNTSDFTDGKYIFAPNHVSEFDGFIFGVLIPNMLVVAKNEWTIDPVLNASIKNLFELIGIERKNRSSGFTVLKKCIEHINKSTKVAVTIFVQQTIADIDLTYPDDVASGAFFIHKKTGAKIIPVYCEQISLNNPTRIIFGEPLICDNPKEFGEKWLNAELLLRDALANPIARKPVLCEKHSLPIKQRNF